MSWRSASGLRPWVVQRLSALYMAGYVIFFSVALATGVAHSYAAWRSWFAYPGVNIATGLFITLLLLHIWVGMRDVVIDYAHKFVWRMTVLVLLGAGLIAMAWWSFRILILVQV